MAGCILAQQLSQYQQNLRRSSDIYDQAVEQINRSALNQLGLGQLEINQYLPENIASRSQPEICLLLQRLQTGDIPPPLQAVLPPKLELIKKHCKAG
ncbi:hypothetical protein BGI39_09665 [Snodgrassella communis]|uniref:hypothetical protein n=1 Tax=Snodgrassella communis TaxID=2946699 RepID=UPI000C1E5663|nr:hypothetical protein [Snodgrassella communis]PIT26545.1 hypothetical protein BGI39_09665 [Snodgrassella communis]